MTLSKNESDSVAPLLKQVEELREDYASKTVIQSYVHHGNKGFFLVSTIDRSSSAALCPGRYNETMVWEFDFKTKERGSILHQDGDALGSLKQHFAICEQLFNNGCIKDDNET